MKSIQIGFIGAGNMAYAIAGGILSLGKVLPEEIGFYDISEERKQLFSSMGMVSFPSLTDLVQSARVLFLAIKPQVCPTVLAEIAPAVSPDHLLISMMAGISVEKIESALKTPCGVILVMPNTPLLLGAGATAIARSPRVVDADYAAVKEIFNAIGQVADVPLDKMNAVISVNGSSPAYVYLFAKAVIDGAVEQGIDADIAKALIAQTLIGSARMLLESGREPQALIDMVTSPGGTTYQALEALSEYRFEEAVHEAMRRCTKRAEELSQT